VVRKLLNSRGATFVEVLIAAGMTGAVSLGVMKLTDTSQKQSIYTKQNIIMDDYIRGLRDYISDKTACDQVLRPDPSGPGVQSPDVSSFPLSSDSGMTIHRTKTLLPRTSTGREVLPVSIFVYFDRNLAENYGTVKARPVKKTTASGIFQDGIFVECSDYESEAERSAFSLACETLGGVVEEDGTGELTCNFSLIPANHIFLDHTKREVCEVYGGVYLGGKCNNMNMPSANFYGQNIQSDNFLISGTRYRTFRQMCPGDNNFVIGMNSDGSVVCKEVKRCTKGDAQCP
tara:strand:+ start:5095 stop:5958 length:864 start_codon:yes stop_codon:yes gene_type:complete